MKITTRIYNILFFLYCFSIPLSAFAKAIPNIILVVLLALFPFVFNKAKFKQIEKIFYSLVGFISILFVFSFLFDRTEDLHRISKIAFIPAILLLSTGIKNSNNILKSYVLGSLILLISSTINIIKYSLHTDNFNLNNGGHINAVLLGERPYLGFTYLISALFLVFLSNSEKNKYIKILYYLLSILFIGFIFFIGARISSISVIIGILLSVSFIAFRKKSSKKILLIVPAILLIFSAISGNIISRTFINNDIKNVFINEPRYHIWDCSVNTISSKPIKLLFGIGSYNTENKLVECYKNKTDFLDAEHKQWFIDSKFNTHNQFLDLLLSHGLIVLSFFILGIIYMFWNYKYSIYNINILIFICLFLLIENVFTRQLGSMIIALAIVFINNNIIKPMNDK